ncbi:YdcF family protein [Hydrogenovibrio sp. 3SP14C1]|uniref:YdcF family protein n=1 Tax=Hydrogenovibrio sp. 3SP14C1 TaxID=3038774 RepID=UPI002415BF39|nr:YdcF family protein [Hydrogenovibrio sp. 3SP14C1]MDG4811612.1 YdcF family protein [Hydrogenovibrio sp. 3SP14C1]
MRLTSSAAQQKIDKDGLLTLSLSIFFIGISLGLSWLYVTRQTYLTAKKASSISASKSPLIVFGKQLTENQIDTDYQLRLDRTLVLIEQVPTDSIILLGGITHDNQISESEAGQSYLLRQHPDLSNRIIIEKASQNTLENLRHAKQYLLARQQTLDVRLVSNRYHLHRCKRIATEMGFNTEIIAAETNFVFSWQNGYKIVIEGFFYHWYHTGAFISRLFNNQRMLSKIK